MLHLDSLDVPQIGGQPPDFKISILKGRGGRPASSLESSIDPKGGLEPDLHSTSLGSPELSQCCLLAGEEAASNIGEPDGWIGTKGQLDFRCTGGNPAKNIELGTRHILVDVCSEIGTNSPPRRLIPREFPADDTH